MCGRYTNTASPARLAARFSVADVPDEGTRRFNVAPTDPVLALVAREERLEPRLLRWGLIPHWSRDARGAARMINARAESVAERPAYRTLLADRRQRCLVVADGYYEWLKAEDRSRPRLPMYFSLEDGEPFAFAGLWTTWRSPEDERVVSATILTTRANPVAAQIHDRMPVILPGPEQWSEWLHGDLDGDRLARLAQPLEPSRLNVRRANPLVNSVRNDGPECLEAALA
ncbi:MAG TPA: SOS response-associated peptidase [Solirubrobacteraceae bacterium]|jgi:putative SOS response-associated peptidase YedK|nr:SOS response-associated peptidase [Solirubrobacteraceae bacterium]